MASWFEPDWPAPDSVGSAITTRQGGGSQGAFDSNNLALHVQDREADVQANRQTLAQSLGLAQPPLWLDQVHGVAIAYVPDSLSIADTTPVADASMTNRAGAACVVMTADCLPVLFCDQQGTQVAAAHAGWRGLCNGILRKTAAQFSRPDQVMAYLGPAIGPQAFEVGPEVLQAFIDQAQDAKHLAAIKEAFVQATNTDSASTDSSNAEVKGAQGKYLADLYALARADLAHCGVTAVYGGGFCTVSDSERFYSYRREAQTGRMASLVWLKSDH
jgi:hypothetical protein